MRHRIRGRKLGRNGSHRRAMFRNMATSLICSLRPDEDGPNKPKVTGRIITTVPKAKELRPIIEKLITLARKARQHEEAAAQYATTAERNSDAWKQWRDSEQWQQWNQAIAPAVAARRRAFSFLRSNEAVDILFSELAERFEDRPGGYTRVVRIAQRRLGDAGEQALIEFVGERDRVRRRREAPKVAPAVTSPAAAPAATKEESPAAPPASAETAETPEKTSESES